jgi:hypothetical protein
MSDLGLLSHQYQSKAELARRLRRHILLIKRSFYGLPFPTSATEADFEESLAETQKIIEFLVEVVPLNEEANWSAKWQDDPPLPIPLVEQLKQLHTLDGPQYIKVLKRLETSVQDTTTLRDKDIRVLEEIAYAANVDANQVFRKLMRWA